MERRSLRRRVGHVESSRPARPFKRRRRRGAGGQILVAERDVTATAPFAAVEALLPLGDRLLLVWAEDHGQNVRALLEDDRPPPSARSFTRRGAQQLTTSPSDSLNPGDRLRPQRHKRRHRLRRSPVRVRSRSTRRPIWTAPRDTEERSHVDAREQPARANAQLDWRHILRSSGLVDARLSSFLETDGNHTPKEEP